MSAMNSVGEKLLLRAYLRSADRSPFVPSHERFVQAARRAKLAGATVLKGILGEGYHGTLKAGAWLRAEQLPVIVEIVDDAERIEQFICRELDQIMTGGMLTLERAAVMMYRGKGGAATPLFLAGQIKPLANVPRIQTGAHMTLNENGVLVRVFIGESDRVQGKPLYEAIVQKARELGLAGATVLRGTEGFGAHSIVHSASLLTMSTDLPIVIEIIDSAEKIQALLPHLETMVKEGMVTMEYVRILMYRHNPADVPPASPDATPKG